MNIRSVIEQEQFYSLPVNDFIRLIHDEYPSELERLKTTYSIPVQTKPRTSEPSPSQILYHGEYDEVNRTLHGLTTPDDLYTVVTSIIINELRNLPTLAADLQRETATATGSQANHDLILYMVVRQAPRLNPCLERIPPSHREHLIRGTELGAVFNFGQMAQAELPLHMSILAKPVWEYYQKRQLKKIEESGDPLLTTPSGYATLDIPYGEKFTATRVCKYVDQHANNHPHFFGTINEVVTQGMKRKKNQGQLSGKITFIKDDPGRQMIGSFYPISNEDWTKFAYKEEGGGSESTS
ncbi:hypothetical protein CDV55_108300 [Aspergillus turcosus]|nr:hypothetical protein CDV55_108300 [Aspergillus turcosus]